MVVPGNPAPRRRRRDDAVTPTTDRHGHLCSPWSEGGRELCDVGLSYLYMVAGAVVVWPGFYLMANLKNDEYSFNNKYWVHLM